MNAISLSDAQALDAEGKKSLAYIGVDGNPYRILVPIASVWIERAEGPIALCEEKTFDSLHDADFWLAQNAKTVEGKGYDKHDYKVTYADGTTYSGRYDLAASDTQPSLLREMRNHLTFLSEGKGPYGPQYQEQAQTWLATMRLDQMAVPADPTDPILHDFRAGDFPKIAEAVWAQAA